LKRLIKKISLKEGEDCFFNISGDLYDGKVEILIDVDLEAKKNTSQELNFDKSIAWYAWSTKTIKNPFSFIQGEKDKIVIISGVVDVDEKYRKSNNPKDSAFNNVFDILVKKLKEVCFDPLKNKYGEDGVFYKGNFFNYKLKQKYLKGLKDEYGIDMYANIMKDNFEKYFNLNLNGEPSRKIEHMAKMIQDIMVDNNLMDINAMKLILNQKRFDINQIYLILSEIRDEEELSEEMLDGLESQQPFEELIKKTYSYQTEEKPIEYFYNKTKDTEYQYINELLSMEGKVDEDYLIEVVKFNPEYILDILENKNIPVSEKLLFEAIKRNNSLINDISWSSDVNLDLMQSFIDGEITEEECYQQINEKQT
jgi:hypothetical protein